MKLDEKLSVNLSLTNIVAESKGKNRVDISSKDIIQTFPNYQFSEFELLGEQIKLPDSKKSDKDINGYFERVKQDKEYKDIKELITEIQKEIVEREKKIEETKLNSWKKNKGKGNEKER